MSWSFVLLIIVWILSSFDELNKVLIQPKYTDHIALYLVAGLSPLTNCCVKTKLTLCDENSVLVFGVVCTTNYSFKSGHMEQKRFGYRHCKTSSTVLEKPIRRFERYDCVRCLYKAFLVNTRLTQNLGHVQANPFDSIVYETTICLWIVAKMLR